MNNPNWSVARKVSHTDYECPKCKKGKILVFEVESYCQTSTYIGCDDCQNLIFLSSIRKTECK